MYFEITDILWSFYSAFKFAISCAFLNRLSKQNVKNFISLDYTDAGNFTHNYQHYKGWNSCTTDCQLKLK